MAMRARPGHRAHRRSVLLIVQVPRTRRCRRRDPRRAERRPSCGS